MEITPPAELIKIKASSVAKWLKEAVGVGGLLYLRQSI